MLFKGPPSWDVGGEGFAKKQNEGHITNTTISAREPLTTIVTSNIARAHSKLSCPGLPTRQQHSRPLHASPTQAYQFGGFGMSGAG